MSVLSSLDFVLSFCREKIPGNGEDCYCYSFTDDAGLLGVFDGCGGAGAREHAYYSGHTEAFMASRLCAGAFYDCFRNNPPEQLVPERFAAEQLAPVAQQCMRCYRPPREAGDVVIKGSMVQTLPTTVASVLVQSAGGGQLRVSPIWAGDSRVYILDEQGLAQLTVDDTTVQDPLENLYEDGLLRRIVTADRPVRLHCHSIRLRPPFLVFAATDGCFGYVSTPMEFEGLLLKTLLECDSAAQWEVHLAETLGTVAGDDHALCLAAFGYGSMAAIHQTLSKRYEQLRREYLNPVSRLPLEDRESRRALWSRYQGDYCRYIKDGDT